MWEYIEEMEENLPDYELLDFAREELEGETHQDVWDFAIHESGHAVAMEVHGPGVDTVSLIPEPEFSGPFNRALSVPLADSPGDLQSPSDHDRSVTKMAGPATSHVMAGKEEYGDRVRRALDGEEVWDNDLVQAADLALSLRLAWRDARELVKKWESEIRAVTEELYSKHKKRVKTDWYHRLPILDGEQVRQIVRKNAEVVDGTLVHTRST